MEPSISKNEEYVRYLRMHESDGLAVLGRLEKASNEEIEADLGVCHLWQQRYNKRRLYLENKLIELRHLKRVEVMAAKARCADELEASDSWRDVVFDDAGVRLAVTQIRGLEKELNKVRRKLAGYESAIGSMQLVVRRRTVEAARDLRRSAAGTSDAAVVAGESDGV